MDFARIESMRELILQDQVSNQVLQVDEQVYIVREYESIQFQTFAPSPKPYSYEVGLDTSELSLPEVEAKLICSWVPAEFEGDSCLFLNCNGRFFGSGST